MTNAKSNVLSKVLMAVISLGLVLMCAIVFTACGKQDPTYDVPTNLTATYGQTLADVTLPDGFSWEDPLTTSVGNAGAHTFKVTYTPEDTNNYNTITGIEVTLTVNKATLQAPTGLTATFGQTLSEIQLPAGFEWEEDADTTVVGNVGTATHTVRYTAEDAENYTNTTGIVVSIEVSGAQNAFVGELSIEGWTYGEQPNAPTGLTANAGTVYFEYSSSADGLFSSAVPTNAGTYYVRGYVRGLTGHQDIVSEPVKFTIAKADPQVSAPTFENAFDVHTTLAEISLPEGFAWVNGETVITTGENEYDAIYTPEDTNNYNVLTVKVTVEGDFILPEMEDFENVDFSITNPSLTNQTGNDVTPEFVVGKLIEDEDYTVKWEYYRQAIGKYGPVYIWDTVDYVGATAGLYRLTITGINDYEGQTKTAEITVNKINFTGSIEISGADFRVVAGTSTVADIAVTERENYFGTLTWDTEDADYSTPLVAGENIRYASISGGNNYNPVARYAVTITVPENVTTVEEFKTALTGANDTIRINSKLVLQNVNLVVPAGKTIIVASKQQLTVQSTASLTFLQGASLVKEASSSKVNSKANNASLGELIMNISSEQELDNAVIFGYISKVVLAKDITISAGRQDLDFDSLKNFTIDLNGHNINGSFAISGEGEKAINVAFTNSQDTESKIIGRAIASVGHMNEVNYAVYVYGNNENFTVTFDNVVVESAGFALSTNGQFAGATISANGSKFVSTRTNGVAVYLPADYAVNFTDCEITGATAVYVKDGDVTITNSTLTANGERFAPQYASGAVYSTGSALVVDSADGYAEVMTVTVTGSTLNSTNGYGIEECMTAAEGNTAIDVAVVAESENTFNATLGDKVILENVYATDIETTFAGLKTWANEDDFAIVSTGLQNGVYTYVAQGTAASMTIEEGIKWGNVAAGSKYAVVTISLDLNSNIKNGWVQSATSTFEDGSYDVKEKTYGGSAGVTERVLAFTDGTEAMHPEYTFWRVEVTSPTTGETVVYVIDFSAFYADSSADTEEQA